MYINSYIDTRGADVCEPLSFTQVIVKGIALGGGLFVPKVLPRLSLEEILGLARLPYHERAALLYRHFGVDMPFEQIRSLMHQAYADNFDTPDITPVRTVGDDIHVLELWHGPTLAFKDMALQCMPLFFSAALSALHEGGTSAAPYPPEVSGSSVDTPGKTPEGPTCISKEALENTASRRGETPRSADAREYLILVATSGDTGTAALAGFSHSNYTNIIVFYPQGGVSELQLRQMLSYSGSNVGVFGLRGNFDSCQHAVKGAFADVDFNHQLIQDYGIALSSANSINWGRLLPQIVYYVSAYAQMVANGQLKAGVELDVCVPTGNFGNILAAYYAAQIGTPIGRLLCASNTNRVLSDFINTGTYDITDRAFVLTPSPSMDILVSSNLERQLFELNGRDPVRIRKWMTDLATTKRFSVDRDTFAAMRRTFVADWASADESLATIKAVYESYGYLLDPHTAVGWQVAERLRGSNPVLLAATAHWSKFGADVYRGLAGLKAASPLPDELACLTGVELDTYIAKNYASAAAVPPSITALAEVDIQSAKVIGSGSGDVERCILDWLAQRRP